MTTELLIGAFLGLLIGAAICSMLGWNSDRILDWIDLHIWKSQG